jgi:hypothetical protein
LIPDIILLPVVLVWELDIEVIEGLLVDLTHPMLLHLVEALL